MHTLASESKNYGSKLLPIVYKQRWTIQEVFKVLSVFPPLENGVKNAVNEDFSRSILPAEFLHLAGVLLLVSVARQAPFGQRLPAGRRG